jgi:hypothetical protein
MWLMATSTATAYPTWPLPMTGMARLRIPASASPFSSINQTLQHDGLTDEHLEAGFIGSQEYIANHGGTSQAWIIGMYQNLLGRTPADSEVAGWAEPATGRHEPASDCLWLRRQSEREGLRITGDYQHISAHLIGAWHSFFSLSKFRLPAFEKSNPPLFFSQLCRSRAHPAKMHVHRASEVPEGFVRIG